MGIVWSLLFVAESLKFHIVDSYILGGVEVGHTYGYSCAVRDSWSATHAQMHEDGFGVPASFFFFFKTWSIPSCKVLEALK